MFYPPSPPLPATQKAERPRKAWAQIVIILSFCILDAASSFLFKTACIASAFGKPNRHGLYLIVTTFLQTPAFHTCVPTNPSLQCLYSPCLHIM